LTSQYALPYSVAVFVKKASPQNLLNSKVAVFLAATPVWEMNALDLTIKDCFVIIKLFIKKQNLNKNK
jgi:hypothetical protein